MNIRQAQEKDVSRIAEILVYNNRTNFYRFLKMKAILLENFRSCLWPMNISRIKKDCRTLSFLTMESSGVLSSFPAGKSRNFM